MNLRLPAILIVVTGAAAVAGFRALRPGAAPPAGVAANGAAGVAEAPAAAEAPPRLPASAASATRAVERVTVYVAGQVVRSGVYTLAPSARANDALRAAGGASPGADLVAVNLAEPVRDGEEIVVPAKGAESADASSLRRTGDGDVTATRRPGKKHRRKRRKRQTSAAAAAEADATAAGPPAETIDLNTADENALETLPGIGPSLASRIVAFREVNGPFTSPDDLLDVGGMTQGRLDAIEPYVTTR
jgi:competence protein ComEA